jgi:hypothetical protein
MALEKRVLPKGTVIHVGPIPFRTEADVVVASAPDSFSCAAHNELGEIIEFGQPLPEV